MTGTPDRDDTAIAAVDAGAQHGRKWPPEPTSRHAVRQGVRIRVFENSDPSEQVGMVRSDGADRRVHLFCEGFFTCFVRGAYSVGTSVEVRLDNGEWAPATITGIKPPVPGHVLRFGQEMILPCIFIMSPMQDFSFLCIVSICRLECRISFGQDDVVDLTLPNPCVRLGILRFGVVPFFAPIIYLPFPPPIVSLNFLSFSFPFVLRLSNACWCLISHATDNLL